MKYCEKCKVNITGKRTICPLCHQALTGDDNGQKEVFPYIPSIFKQHSLMFRWALFFSVISAVICVTINLAIPKGGMWSLFVVGGIICLWISLTITICKRKNLIKTILYQVVTLSILSILWDHLTSWRGWSLDFVVPIICVSAMIAMGIITKVMKLEIQDYIIYLVIDSLFGIIPIIFLLLNMINIIIPTLICIGLSIISLSALLIFEGQNMKLELKKRLHL